MSTYEGAEPDDRKLSLFRALARCVICSLGRRGTKTGAPPARSARVRSARRSTNYVLRIKNHAEANSRPTSHPQVAARPAQKPPIRFGYVFAKNDPLS